MMARAQFLNFLHRLHRFSDGAVCIGASEKSRILKMDTQHIVFKLKSTGIDGSPFVGDYGQEF